MQGLSRAPSGNTTAKPYDQRDAPVRIANRNVNPCQLSLCLVEDCLDDIRQPVEQAKELRVHRSTSRSGDNKRRTTLPNPGNTAQPSALRKGIIMALGIDRVVRPVLVQ